MNRKGILFLAASFLTLCSLESVAQNTNVVNNISTVNVGNASKTHGTKRIIPVVFHIIHQYREENIPNEVIFKQLASLNRDFSMTNPDVNDTSKLNATFKKFAASMDIEFRLAQKDPKGNPTNGIERIADFRTLGDAVTSFYNVNLDKLKEATSWDSRKYLNIWVVRSLPRKRGAATNVVEPYVKSELDKDKKLIFTDSCFSSVSLPEYRATVPSHDGIVIAYSFIGDSVFVGDPKKATLVNVNDAGRSLTKCVGHWLGLKNLWADSDCADDGAKDTPRQQRQNHGRPTFPLKNFCYSKNDTINPDSSQMFMNFMDYTYGKYRVMFTAGQKLVVDNVLNTLRKGISDTANLRITGVRDNDTSFIIKPAPTVYMSNTNLVEKPTAIGTPGILGGYTTRIGIPSKGPFSVVTFTDSTSNCNVGSRKWRFPGGTPGTATTKSVKVTYTTPGSYDVILQVTSDKGSVDSTVLKYAVNVKDSTISRYSLATLDSLKDEKDPTKYKYYYSYSEDFEGIQYVTDKGWAFNHCIMNNSDSVDWRITNNAAYSGQTSLMLPLYNNRNHDAFGDVYELITPSIGFGNFVDELVISFKVAYAKLSTLSTQEKVYISYSNNSGHDWYPFDSDTLHNSQATFIDYNKFLSGGIYYGDYYPTSKDEWKEIRISPTIAAENNNENYKGQAAVMFKFKFVGGAWQSVKSNNIFLDDFKICAPVNSVGVADQKSVINNLSVYPVPSSEIVKVNFSLSKSDKVKITVMDILGKELKSLVNQNLSDGYHQYVINNDFGAGIYFVKIQVGQKSVVKKIVFN